MVFDYCERLAGERAFQDAFERRLEWPCKWGEAHAEAIDRLEQRRGENRKRVECGMKPLEPPDERNMTRLIRVTVRRLYGFRPAVIEDASRHFGLSKRTIKRIWLDGRRLVRGAEELIGNPGSKS